MQKTVSNINVRGIIRRARSGNYSASKTKSDMNHPISVQRVQQLLQKSSGVYCYKTVQRPAQAQQHCIAQPT